MKLLRRASDRLLEAVLPSAVAGACVPENGSRCTCSNHVLYRYNCTGSCVTTSTFC